MRQSGSLSTSLLGQIIQAVETGSAGGTGGIEGALFGSSNG